MYYRRSHIVLHWLTAILVVLMAASGLAYSYDLADKLAMTTHQIMGQLLIVVLILRLELRLTKPPKFKTTAHALWEHLAAKAVHWGLYLCLTLYVVTGYISASALGENVLLFPVDRVFARSDLGEQFLEMHYLLKWILLSLFALHLGAVLKHKFWDQDDTFSNMTLPLSKENPNA